MKDKLLKQSADAAQRAIRHYLNREFDQLFIQAGISFELLGKARLASFHPSLIVDKDFDSLLHCCGAGKHSRRPPWNLKTITATEVLKRNIQLHPELNSVEKRLVLLAEYRNSTIHLGEVPESEVTPLLRSYLSGSSILLKTLGLSREAFFGEFSEMVSKQLDETLAETQRLVAERIARAKDDFKRRYAVLDSEQLQALVKTIEAGNKNLSDKYTQVEHECPCCGNLGILHGDYDVDWVPDDYDDSGSPQHAYAVVTLNPSFFACNVCCLNLDGTEQLKVVGLDAPVGLEGIDPSDFYEDYSEYQ